MSEFLDWFSLSELFPLVMLIFLLIFIGGQMAQHDSGTYRRARRFSAAVFLLYAGMGIYSWSPSGATDFVVLLLRAALAAGVGFGLALLLLAPAIFVIEHVQAILPKPAPPRAVAHRRLPLPPIPPRDPVVDDQKLLQHMEEQRLANVEQHAAQQRREEARLRSDLLYERHARQLAASFPRERFVQFVERYMGEGTAPDLVEQRELLLKEMILDSLGTATAPKFPTMTELATFFEARRQEINQLPHEEHVKDTYRTQLNKQEDEALRRFLKP